MLARNSHFLHKRAAQLAHVSSPASVSSANTPEPSQVVFPSSAPGPAQTPEASSTAPQASIPFSISVPFSALFPTQTTSSSPSQSSSVDVKSSPSSSSASSSVISTTSASSTPLVVIPQTTVAHTPVGTTAAVASVSFTAASHSPSATSTTGTSSGVNTSAIVGGIAGVLAGIAVLGFLFMWCMRRQRNRDVDDFDARAFKRQSAMLVDDPIEPPQSYNPRPPTMFENHNASPALATQAAYGGQNFYGNYGGYAQQPPHAAPEMMQPGISAPSQVYATPQMGYPGYNDAQPQIVRQPSDVGYANPNSLARQPSDPRYLTRQPTAAAGYAPTAPTPGPADADTSYIDLNRSSVSPYQAAQYADISRRLGTFDPNELPGRDSKDLPVEPLPSPFDDPAEASHPSQAAPPTSVTATSAPHQRPATVYEEGDAYGGI